MEKTQNFVSDPTSTLTAPADGEKGSRAGQLRGMGVIIEQGLAGGCQCPVVEILWALEGLGSNLSSVRD